MSRIGRLKSGLGQSMMKLVSKAVAIADLMFIINLSRLSRKFREFVEQSTTQS